MTPTFPKMTPTPNCSERITQAGQTGHGQQGGDLTAHFNPHLTDSSKLNPFFKERLLKAFVLRFCGTLARPTDHNTLPINLQGTPCAASILVVGVGGAGGPPTTGPAFPARPQAPSEAVGGRSQQGTVFPLLDIMSHIGTFRRTDILPSSLGGCWKDARNQARGGWDG
jgi:hypothetical protein